MGTAQSTHTTLEINDLPYEGKEVSSSVSGRKSNEDLRLVEPALISVQDEVVETLDEEDYESDYMDSDDDDGFLGEPFIFLIVIYFVSEGKRVGPNLSPCCSVQFSSVHLVVTFFLMTDSLP